MGRLFVSYSPNHHTDSEFLFISLERKRQSSVEEEAIFDLASAGWEEW
jgi:hypothetical protein